MANRVYDYYEPKEEKYGGWKTAGKFVTGLLGGGTVGSSIQNILDEKQKIKDTEYVLRANQYEPFDESTEPASEYDEVINLGTGGKWRKRMSAAKRKELENDLLDKELSRTLKQVQIDALKSGQFYIDTEGNVKKMKTSEGEIVPGKATVKTLPRESNPLPMMKYEDKKAETEKSNAAKSDFVKTQAQDALDTIGKVEEGIGNFGLFGNIPSIPGSKRTVWETNLNKLLSGKVIDVMTEMKNASRTGATGFGQLSEKELAVLQQASTALKKGLPPQEAQAILNEMKVKLQKVIAGSSATPILGGNLINTSKPAQKSGGQLMEDAQGNKAMVYPDGTIEEVQ